MHLKLTKRIHGNHCHSDVDVHIVRCIGRNHSFLNTETKFHRVYKFRFAQFVSNFYVLLNMCSSNV